MAVADSWFALDIGAAGIIGTEQYSDRQQNSQSRSAAKRNPSSRFALLARADIRRIRRCHSHSCSPSNTAIRLVLATLEGKIRSVKDSGMSPTRPFMNESAPSQAGFRAARHTDWEDNPECKHRPG